MDKKTLWGGTKEMIIFVLGVFVGMIIGITVMCLMQIAKDGDNE